MLVIIWYDFSIHIDQGCFIDIVYARHSGSEDILKVLLLFLCLFVSFSCVCVVCVCVCGGGGGGRSGGGGRW